LRRRRQLRNCEAITWVVRIGDNPNARQTGYREAQQFEPFPDQRIIAK